MDCFKSIIGVRGFCDDSTNYTYYLDDLGITQQMIEDINHTHDNAQELFNDRLEFVERQMFQQVQTAMKGKLRIRSLLQNKKIGHPANKRSTTSSISDNYLGIRFTIPQNIGDVKVDIETISLFADHAGDVEIKVFNLKTAEEVDSTTISVLAGNSTSQRVKMSIPVGVDGGEFFIGYISTFDVYKTVRKLGCESCSSGYGSMNNMVYASGAAIEESATKLTDNIVTKSETYGLGIGYSISCDHDEWLCRSASQLALPFLYRLGYEIAMAGLLSIRNNNLTTVNRETLEKMAEEYSGQSELKMKAALDGLQPNNDNICIQCKKKSIVTSWIP